MYQEESRQKEGYRHWGVYKFQFKSQLWQGFCIFCTRFFFPQNFKILLFPTYFSPWVLSGKKCSQKVIFILFISLPSTCFFFIPFSRLSPADYTHILRHPSNIPFLNHMFFFCSGEGRLAVYYMWSQTDIQTKSSLLQYSPLLPVRIFFLINNKQIYISKISQKLLTCH